MSWFIDQLRLEGLFIYTSACGKVKHKGYTDAYHQSQMKIEMDCVFWVIYEQFVSRKGVEDKAPIGTKLKVCFSQKHSDDNDYDSGGLLLTVIGDNRSFRMCRVEWELL